MSYIKQALCRRLAEAEQERGGTGAETTEMFFDGSSKLAPAICYICPVAGECLIDNLLNYHGHVAVTAPARRQFRKGLEGRRATVQEATLASKKSNWRSLHNRCSGAAGATAAIEDAEKIVDALGDGPTAE